MGFSKWLYGAGKEGITITSDPGLPEIEPLDEELFGKNRYRLIETYTYDWRFKINEDHYSEHKIIVPKDFIYDGASVPAFVTRLTGIRRDGEHRAAALLHDWLYHHKGRLPGEHYQINFEGEHDDTWATWTREEADRLFGRVMREFGYTRWKRVWAYRTVRWFGWLVWHDIIKLRQIILSLFTVAFFASIIIPFYFLGDFLRTIFARLVK
jgi:hypothetical protein